MLIQINYDDLCLIYIELELIEVVRLVKDKLEIVGKVNMCLTTSLIYKCATKVSY